MTTEQPEHTGEPIEHGGVSPPESGFIIEGLSRDQILMIGKALLCYSRVTYESERHDLPDHEALERARRRHEGLLLSATFDAYRTAFGEYLAKDPFNSVGWLIQVAQSADEAGANVLAGSIGAVAAPLDERGYPTPTMQSLYYVLYALDMYGGNDWANSSLAKLHADGYLSAEQVADYMKYEPPHPPMPQS